MMKKILTREELKFRMLSSGEYIRNMFTDTDVPRIYSLVVKYSKTSSKAYFRFFAVDDITGMIEDISLHVHYITEYPMKDCTNYWAIWTHSTNAQDIVSFLSEKCTGDPAKYKLERL